jgi:hypothetical protein
LVLAAAIGWGAITRPLTMLAFAVPVGLIVIRDVLRTRAWRDLGLAVGLGVAILGVIPVWSARTTGDWKLTPQSLYTRDYLPYDKPGFGVDSTPPAMKLNPVNEFTYAGFYPQHVRHTVAHLPYTIWERLRAIATQEWPGVRVVLVPFVLLGLVSMSTEVGFALICSAALFVGYLSYGHWSAWTIYYFEAFPILSVLAALGLWRACTAISSSVGDASHRERTKKRILIGAAIASGAMSFGVVIAQRRDHVRASRPEERAHRALSGLPSPGAVVFVRYVPGLHPHVNLVQNSAHLDREPVWFVNDMGERDSELMSHAGGRIPLVFDERDGRYAIDSSLVRR